MKYEEVILTLEDILAEIDRDSFIAGDPISIPHRFTKKEDVEIAAFFAAVLAWGQRVTIIRNTNKLMAWMDEAPHDFILHHSEEELKSFAGFVHRTFNGTDCLYFIAALKWIYSEFGTMEDLFSGADMKEKISCFHQRFFSLDYAPQRTRKHISNPSKNSAAKRINMFLRWMVRKDPMHIDFGIWENISSAELMCPLDVHVDRAARHLGLISRKQQDWKCVEELTQSLRDLDKQDPIKYDLALFILGQRL